MVNANPNPKPVIIWRNPDGWRFGQGRARARPMPTDGGCGSGRRRVDCRRGCGRERPTRALGVPPLAAGPKTPLRDAVSAETAKRLNFGESPDGTPIGPDDFASDGSVMFEVPMPEGFSGVDLQVDAEVGRDRDQVFRILISDREDGGSQGIPTRALVGDPKSAGYKTFRAGVMEFAALLPPNSHGEPTPADKDPVPLPFDNTYNVPEHDEFVRE